MNDLKDKQHGADPTALQQDPRSFEAARHENAQRHRQPSVTVGDEP
jgi:hypothetical protein